MKIESYKIECALLSGDIVSAAEKMLLHFSLHVDRSLLLDCFHGDSRVPYLGFSQKDYGVIMLFDTKKPSSLIYFNSIGFSASLGFDFEGSPKIRRIAFKLPNR
jgi:hypothetical protein